MDSGDGLPCHFQPSGSITTSVDSRLTDFPLASITDARIKAALILIGNSIAGGVNASGIASSVGLSRSRFEHLFKAQTGSSFRVAVKAMRLATARTLLADPRLRIKEVAGQCGYAATSHLSREFKREFGITPSEYRRSRSGQQIAH